MDIESRWRDKEKAGEDVLGSKWGRVPGGGRKVVVYVGDGSIRTVAGGETKNGDG